MNDLISRKALLDELEWLKSNVSESSKAEVDEYIQRVKNIPAVDAIEKLTAENAQLRRERDAAVADLKNDSHCLQCIHHRSVGGYCFGVSMYGVCIRKGPCGAEGLAP